MSEETNRIEYIYYCYDCKKFFYLPYINVHCERVASLLRKLLLFYNYLTSFPPHNYIICVFYTLVNTFFVYFLHFCIKNKNKLQLHLLN